MADRRELMIAIDGGATNVRARVAAVDERDATTAGRGAGALADVALPVAADITAKAGSAQALYEFVADVVRVASDHGAIASAVVAVAGMVEGEHSRVSNWPTDALVEVGRLEDAGLPAGRTQLVNDVVAGVWGAEARMEGGGAEEQASRIDSARSADLRSSAARAGNLVYIAPGTGLGAAVLIRHGLGPLGGTVVACESQHTQIPRFEGEIARAVDAITDVLGRAPSWEELVSGPGLVRLYRAQCAIAGCYGLALPLGGGPEASTGAAAGAGAATIAEAAHRGDDPQALAAVRIYYLTLGHFAQTLALSYLPCADVVIGGASTARNRELLADSGLAETFAEHPRFGAMLSGIHVGIVDGEVNLEGGLWLAALGR